MNVFATCENCKCKGKLFKRNQSLDVILVHTVSLNVGVQAGIQILAKNRLRKRSECEFFFEKNCEAKAKRTSNYFLRIRFAFAVFAELQENLKENFSHKNCAKFFAYFSFALFFTVFLKIGTNRISLMKKYIISPTRPSV
jgi:hypothetical protein